MSGVDCKALRKRLNLTQQEFADQLGICRTVVVRGERTTPSVLLSRVAAALFNQEKLEQLRLQLQEQTALIEALTLAHEGGPSALLAEQERLQRENADLNTAIKVMAKLGGKPPK